MKTIITILLSCQMAFLYGQRLVSLNPDKDPVARMDSTNKLKLTVPLQTIEASLAQAFPEFEGIQLLGIQKIGKSNYLLAKGQAKENELINIYLSILLVQNECDSYLLDDLIITCSGSGECRECTTPPQCQCNKGEGTCEQSKVLMKTLPRVTLTILD
ncbi:MAG: hypothetical protein H6576_15870 [Lewinellaceae bacterium]|nr:hypothetical protein [Lewinellaceae bacterium]